MRALWDAFDAVPGDVFFATIGVFLIAYGLTERAMRGWSR